MRASFYTGNKSFTAGEIDPRALRPDEARIKVSYCGICGTDLHIFHGRMDQRVNPPRVIGHECSGIIEEISLSTANFKKGDRVVVRPLHPCGECPACLDGYAHICHRLKFLGIDTDGAFQEFWTVPAFAVHKLPDNLSLELGALIEPLAVACHDVRISGIKKGETAVIIGGGPIGMLVALVARESGADAVITEINPVRIKFAKSLGFETINPDESDVEAYINDKTRARGADVVFEVSGSANAAKLMTQIIKTRGTIVVVAIYTEKPPLDLHRFFWREITLKGARVYEPEDYEAAISIASKGNMPLERMITRIAPLSDIQSAFENAGSAADMKTLIKI